VLLRLTNLRGVNLDVFDFDYDLTWVALFLTSDERVLGRFGGRTPDDPNQFRTIEALQFAMESALQRFKEGQLPEKLPERAPRTVELYPGFARFGPNSCAHCHHAYDLRREMLQDNGTWTTDEIFVYPLPENAGWTMAVTPGNKISAVGPGTAADAAGMKAADLLVEVNRETVASFTDVQHALHRAPAAGEIEVKWTRGGKAMEAKLTLPQGWRQTDVSWRRSLKSLEPGSRLHGDDLTAMEKKQLGLAPKALAFRQGNFPTKQARQAGVQQNDVIVGVDGKKMDMTVRQFDAFIRLNYHVGDTVTINVMRDGKQLELRMTL
jgi:hypothetical protein